MLSDQEIMTRSRQGQNDLLDVLIDRHGSDLYTFCLRLCRRRTDADDLFQDSWLAVLRHGWRYDAQKPFRPWLFTVCLNMQRDRFRRAKRWLKVLAGHQVESGRTQGMQAAAASPEGALAGSEKKARLKTALARLDESLRLPLLLHYYCGMPLTEIADSIALVLIGLLLRQQYTTLFAVDIPQKLLTWFHFTLTFTLLIAALIIAIDLVRNLVRLGRKHLAK